MTAAGKERKQSGGLAYDYDVRGLVEAAREARLHSYSPYSHFQVGAALLTENGRIYTGCNIENAAYTPTNCAERTAFFKAVSEGEHSFRAIAIAGGPEGSSREEQDFCPPCGVCRQVMMEFCDPDTFQVILAKSETEYQVFTLRELLPCGFGPADLGLQKGQAGNKKNSQ